MPVGPTIQGRPLAGYPLSYARLRRFLNEGDPLLDWLQWQAIKDVIELRDDFRGPALDTTNNWAVANGGGASAASFVTNVQYNGVVRGTTGTAGDNTASASLASPKMWLGDQFAMAEFRFAPITAVTEFRIEVGFTDVVPGSAKSVANSLTSPTVNTSVGDAVVLLVDHTGSTTTNECVAIGSAAPGNTAQKYTYTAPNSLAAATYRVARVHLQQDGFMAWLDGVKVATQINTDDASIEGTTTTVLWVRVGGSNGTSKSCDLDYVVARQLR